jgi:hypothetical protein
VRVASGAADLWVAVVRAELRARPAGDVATWTAVWLPSLQAAFRADPDGSGVPAHAGQEHDRDEEFAVEHGQVRLHHVITYVLPPLLRLHPVVPSVVAAAVRENLRAWLAVHRLAALPLPAADTDVMRMALVHADGDVRCEAWALLVASARGSADTDTLVRHFVEHNLTVTEADVRQRQAVAMTTLWERLRDKPTSLLPWLLDTLWACLYPGVGYQRALTALTWLAAWVKVVGGPAAMATLATTETGPAAAVVLLQERVEHDTYDANRRLAAHLVVALPAVSGAGVVAGASALLWERAMARACSVRGQESEGGATLVRLVYARHDADGRVRALDDVAARLDRALALAERDLATAAAEAPMFGLLDALHQCVLQGAPVRAADAVRWRLVAYRALAVVRPVLVHATPEGHADTDPEAVDDLVDAADHGDEAREEVGPQTQVVNSCCWRTLRAASLLLATLVAHAAPEDEDEADARDAAAEATGTALLELLGTLRHLGAVTALFEVVSTLAQTLHQSPRPRQSRLPAAWLDATLAGLPGRDGVSVTRRSAGLPYAVVALVRAETTRASDAPRRLLAAAMAALLAHARTPLPHGYDQRVDLPQVHAYNVLRALFRDAVLAPAVLPYVPDALGLALDGYDSARYDQSPGAGRERGSVTA